jgi:hypothetical protein
LPTQALRPDRRPVSATDQTTGTGHAVPRSPLLGVRDPGSDQAVGEVVVQLVQKAVLLGFGDFVQLWPRAQPP